MKEYFAKNKVRINKRTKLPKIGDKFVNFTVIEDQIYGLDSSNHNYLKCKCSCGHIAFERIDHLNKGKSTGCFECNHIYKKRDYKEVGNLSSQMFSDIKRNAKIRNIEFNVSMRYLWNLFEQQKEKCALSGMHLTLINIRKKKVSRSEITASLDRISSDKGYVEGNVQWVHKAINIMKGSLNNSEFINICKHISQIHQDYHDNFEPSQLNGYMKRFLYNTFSRSKLEGATHRE